MLSVILIVYPANLLKLLLLLSSSLNSPSELKLHDDLKTTGCEAHTRDPVMLELHIFGGKTIAPNWEFSADER